MVSDGLRDWILEVENPGKSLESMVEKRLLEGNIGYTKIWGEIDVDLKDPNRILQRLPSLPLSL